jgi:hypothetical protein
MNTKTAPQPRRKKSSYICPSCGGTDTLKSHWSGETGTRRGFYEGPWIECTNCALQGPKKIWDEMVNRSNMIQLALNKDVNATTRYDRYAILIARFNTDMFRELVANDAKKGDFLEWKPDDQGAIDELSHHYHKLVVAIGNRERKKVAEFCADMGNIAMGIKRNLG